MTTAPKYDSFEARWNWLLSFGVFADPFTAEMLSLFKVVESKQVPTMGVSVSGMSFTLQYNRDWAEALPDSGVRYVLNHEMKHVALHHITTRKETDPAEHARHNEAADLEANSLIVENAEIRMPPPPHTGLLPAQFGFQDKLSLEQYFDLLKKEEQKSKGKDDKGKGSGDGKGKGNGDGKGDPSNSNGQGQGAGDGTGDPTTGSNGSNPGGGGKGKLLDSHDGWADGEDIIADEIIRQKIREMEVQNRCWGNMPADARQHILEAQRSRVAWHKLLRYVLGQSVSRSLVHTIMRPHRRFGWPYTGFKKDCTDRVLVLWDTSGSIHDHELSMFLSEVNRIAESHPVDVQMFDAGLQGKLLPFNRKMKSIEVVGRGGTSFKEPFEFAEKMRYSLVVCLTDGGAPAIERPKYVKQIIWAIVGGGKPLVDWGRVVRIDTVNGRHQS